MGWKEEIEIKYVWSCKNLKKGSCLANHISSIWVIIGLGLLFKKKKKN